MHFPIALEYVPFERRYPPGWFFDPDAPSPKMHPVPVPIAETWQAMEQLVDAGLVKYIGVCNFGTSLLRDLLSDIGEAGSSNTRASIVQVLQIAVIAGLSVKRGESAFRPDGVRGEMGQ